MNSIIIAIVVLMPILSYASEYDRRVQLRDERNRAVYLKYESQRQANAEAAYIAGIAQSMGLPITSVVKTGRQSWATVDGRIVCQLIAEPMGGGSYVSCVNEDGRDVGGIDWDRNGQMILRKFR